MQRDPEELFAQGIALFNSGHYFECHEVLEDLWKEADEADRWFFQSLIHFAVAFHHHEQGNSAGAQSQLLKGLGKIQGYLPQWRGVRTDSLEREMRLCSDIIESGGSIDHPPIIRRSL